MGLDRQVFRFLIHRGLSEDAQVNLSSVESSKEENREGSRIGVKFVENTVIARMLSK